MKKQKLDGEFVRNGGRKDKVKSSLYVRLEAKQKGKTVFGNVEVFFLDLILNGGAVIA